MYHITICDDESEILYEIHKKVRRSFEENEVSAEFSCLEDSRELMQSLQNENIDVLFLDIDMPYFSGMDVAGAVNEMGLKTILVFVTSHDALVYQTFAYRPFGFLRKTHIDEELDELVKRIGKELLDRKQELVIQKGTEIIRILIKDIVYIEAEGNYLNICLKEDVVKVRETMTKIEKELGCKGFIRCHKGYLINGEYIGKMKSTEIEMKYGQGSKTIPVGRSYEKDIRKRIFELIRN